MEFDGKKGFVAPQTVTIIGTYDENGVPNAMNAAWCMQSDTAELTISLGKHKTTDNFQKTGAFTVAFATVKTLVISDYFGVETGRNVNKIETAGVHVHKSTYVNAPVIEEYPLTLECRVIYREEQDASKLPEEIIQKFYSIEKEDHISYYGEIKAAYILEEEKAEILQV